MSSLNFTPRTGLLLITLGFLSLAGLQVLPFIQTSSLTAYSYVGLMGLSLLAYSIYRWRSLRDFRLIVEPFFLIVSGLLLGFGSSGAQLYTGHVFFLVGSGFVLGYLLWLSDLHGRLLVMMTGLFAIAASVGLILPLLSNAVPVATVSVNQPASLADTGLIVSLLWLLMAGMWVCRMAVMNTVLQADSNAETADANQAVSQSAPVKDIVTLDDSASKRRLIDDTNGLAAKWSQLLKKVSVELSFERNLPHLFTRLFEIAHPTMGYDAASVAFITDSDIVDHRHYDPQKTTALRHQNWHSSAISHNLSDDTLTQLKEKRSAMTLNYQLDDKDYEQLVLPIFSKSQLAAVVSFVRTQSFEPLESQYLSSLLFHAVLAFRMGQMTKLLAKNRLQLDDIFSGVFNQRKIGVICKSSNDFAERTQSLLNNVTQPHPEVSMIYLKVSCRHVVQNQAAKDAVLASINHTLNKILPPNALAGLVAQGTYAITLPQNLMYSQTWAETLNSTLIDQLALHKNQLSQMPEVNIGLASTNDMNNGLDYLMKHAEEGLLMAQQQQGSVISVSL